MIEQQKVNEMDKLIYCGLETSYKTRSSWLRDDEAVYWVSIGQQCWYLVVLSQYEAATVGN